MKNLAPIMVLVSLIGSALALNAAEQLGWSVGIVVCVALNGLSLLWHSTIVACRSFRLLPGEG